jgi:hypothetical protein
MPDHLEAGTLACRQGPRRVIVRLPAVFVHEICAIAPDLSTLGFAVANDSRLN